MRKRTSTYYGAIDIGGTKIASALVAFATEQTGDFASSSDLRNGHPQHCDRDISATVPTNGKKLSEGEFDPVHSGLVNAQIVEAKSVPTQAEAGGKDVAKRVCHIAYDLVRQAERHGWQLSGIGIGSAGVIDPVTGAIASATDIMPGWAGIELQNEVAQTVNLPVSVINDVAAHALSEAWFGAGQGLPHIVCAAIGTGLGGAVVTDGRLESGAHGVAGHIGHICHRLGAGLLCSCGTRAGHLEAVTSGYGLVQLYEIKRKDDDNAKTYPQINTALELDSEARAGNALALQVLEESGRACGESLASIAHIVDPDAFVLSGSIMNSPQIFIDSIRAGFTDTALPQVKKTPIFEAEGGPHTALIGAAWNLHQILEV